MTLSKQVQSSLDEEVASLRNALAIESRCFSPPESLTPFSPINVSYDFGKLSINSLAAAKSQAFFISSKAGGGTFSFRNGNIATAVAAMAMVVPRRGEAPPPPPPSPSPPRK